MNQLVSMTSLVSRAAMKRAQRGLYGGKEVMFGNNVSFSERKTRRKWNVNVQSKAFHSEVLNRDLRLKCTTAVIRTVRQKFNNSIDDFLIGTKPSKLNSQIGLHFRKRIIAAKEKTASS